jgi:RNA polymerase sigma factor (sigma-70 family)
LDTLNDPTFVRNLMAGDATAFSTLCDGLKRKLPEFIVRASGLNYSDAEEVASEVLFKVHGSIKNYKPRADAKLTTWVFEIAKHAAIDRKRKLASQCQAITEETDHDGPQRGPTGKKHKNLKRPTRYESEMLGEDDSGDSPRILPYKNAFAKLSEREKDILRMKNVLAYAEISAVEPEEVGALRTRHSRALKRLCELTNNGGDSDE